ncbi:YmaF family protein [Oxobacter pfennigii]|uniref:YmaF family protein n=1 Tax=Oxobacter pfennigii TaxID=36849 RepID=A0A0N8NSS4_9CLOT|nr:YmaF family protein [Oxobacter pfennigii]KPU42840.1 YmaF family protein [Oxobacter pfennigii]
MSDYSKHEHYMNGNAEFFCDHGHKIKDLETQKPLFNGDSYNHIHFFEGETSKSEHHRHKICYYTGPAIPAACGYGHYHYFYGVTSIDDDHSHYYRGITDIEDNE